MNASKLQTCLLDQLRIVIKGQKMVCWVAPSLPIKIRSAHSSILQPHTEIAVILFQENQIEKDDTTINNNEINNMHYYASSIYESTLKDSILSDNTVFRAVIFPTIDKNYHIFDVYTFNNATNMKENNVYILMNMENNNPAREKDKSDQNEDIIVKQLYVRVKLLMNNPNIKEVDLMSPYPPLMISKSIANLMNLESGSKLVLEEIIQHFPTPNVIEISPVNHLTPDLEKYFKMFISNQSSPENSILINQDTVLNLSPIKDIWCQVKLYPANMQFALLSGDSLSECKVISNQNLIQPSEDRISFKGQIDSEEFCRNISLFESIISNCIRDFKTEMLLKKNLHTHLKLRNHIFILGKKIHIR